MGGLWEALFDITEYTCCRLHTSSPTLFAYLRLCFVSDWGSKEGTIENLFPFHLSFLSPSQILQPAVFMRRRFPLFVSS